jgi:hypothetical protein
MSNVDVDTYSYVGWRGIAVNETPGCTNILSRHCKGGGRDKIYQSVLEAVKARLDWKSLIAMGGIDSIYICMYV